MQDCNYLYALAFTVGGNSGIALVSARSEADAMQVLRNSGQYNGVPFSYIINQIRNIGLTSTIRTELLLESYVNAMGAYEALIREVECLKGDKGDKGDKGEDGEKGDMGTAAGFGIPEASVDANIGIPSVEVSSSGPDMAKVFTFVFHNLKGEKGDPGCAIWGDITGTLADQTDLKNALDGKMASNANLSDLGNVSSTSPIDGQALIWDSTNSTWKPGAAGASDAVKYTSQSLTSEEQAQARANIGTAAISDVGNPVVSISSPTPSDGTVIFTYANGDATTVDLNHSHDNYALKQEVKSAIPPGGLAPNTLYNLGTVTGTVTIPFDSPTDNTIVNEYMFTFDTSSTEPTMTFPASITAWSGNCIDVYGLPEIKASKYYEVSVIGGKGIIIEF